MPSYHYGLSGETYYAKPEPLASSPSWVADIVEGVENGSTGSFAFTLDGSKTYAVFLQAGGSPASSDVIEAAFPSDSLSLTSDNIAAIALGIFRRLAGGSASIGQLTGAVQGGPLDAINSADFNYTASIETDATSTIIFSIRRCVDDSVPQLEADSADGLTILNGVDAPTAEHAVITRISGTQVSITIAAAAIAALTPGTYASEIRELTDNETLSKLELPLIIRRSASRRIAS